MLGMGPIIWRQTHRRVHAGYHAMRGANPLRPVTWHPPVSRRWATTPGRRSPSPAAREYYKALDHINLGFSPC